MRDVADRVLAELAGVMHAGPRQMIGELVLQARHHLGHREQEKSLQSTLLSAQKLADDIRQNAEEEGRRIIREAQGRSELLLEKTQSRAEDIQREIDGLKLKRRDVETSIESIMQALRNTLEYVREQDTREREDKILFHRPRHTEQEAKLG